MPSELSEKPSVALIGECMIELREMFDGQLTRGYGGDVLNTAVYMSRLLGEAADVRFTTVLGDDPFSEEMIAAWRHEGVVCDTVGRKPGSNAGLYFVKTDQTGERTFYYWRHHAPARDLMDAQWTELRDLAFRSSWIYLTGISLAILDDAGRTALSAALAEAKERGAKIVFDGNYRPSLWSDPQAAKYWYERFWPLCSLALAGAEDEVAVFADASPEASIERLHGYGIDEVVVKRGSDAVLVSHGGDVEAIEAQAVADILDTTAAGDSFNAAYLDGRIRGRDPGAAAAAGAALAAVVIQHPGAIIPASAMPVPDIPDHSLRGST